MAKTEVTGAQIKDQSVSLTADVTGVLPVANGGSGSNTIALNNVVLGNGTGAVQTVAPGTSGNVLTSDGTTWKSSAPTGGTSSTRINSTASSATPSINVDTTDQFNITALAVNITSVTVTGTPTDGQKLIIRIKDNGTARSLAFGSSFSSSGSVSLPTTTVINKTHMLGFIYDDTTGVKKWILLAADNNGY